jgi:hypothetical protein
MTTPDVLTGETAGSPTKTQGGMKSVTGLLEADPYGGLAGEIN